MDRNSDRTQPRSRRILRHALPVGALLFLAGAFAYGLSGSGTPERRDDEWATKFIDVPVAVASPAVPAASARLRPGAPVIGVSVGKWFRAYPVESMSQSRSHIVNDTIDGQAVTVAYCDRTRCARIFTAPDRAAPLDLAVGGWFNEEGANDMLVRIGTNRYRLKSGQPLDGGSPAFPYAGVEVEITTWHEWRTAHPETDVFFGVEWPLVQN